MLSRENTSEVTTLSRRDVDDEVDEVDGGDPDEEDG